MDKSQLQFPGADGTWASFVSKYPPDHNRIQPNMFTINSKNFITDATGNIDKRTGGTKWNQTAFSFPFADSQEIIFQSGVRHALGTNNGVLTASTGNGVYTTITSGFNTSGNFEWVVDQNRGYGCNGINSPQVYDIVTSYGGVTYSFTTGKTKVMGAQPPVAAPTSHTPTSGGAVPNGAHTYRITFLYYATEEESNASPASTIQTATTGFNTVSLTAIPIGGYGCVARNIYRDNNDGVYLLLDSLQDNQTTTYSDVLAQGSTPTPMPLFNDVPPTFSKIALWLDSIWVAGVSGDPNILLYSNTGSPDVFDPNNFIVCQADDVITAISVFNGKLYVWGTHSFGSIEGTTPDTYYYHNISNTIGCVDNRSIQVRTLVSAPTLWWTSSKGFFYSDGYNVTYASDAIEDLVNFQLSQVNYTTNANTQTSQVDFQGDTSSPGIDLDSNPGAIQTFNPKKSYSTNADWTGGSVLTNLATVGIGDLLGVPTQFAPTLPQGSLSGAALSDGTNLTLSIGSNFTGYSEDDNYQVAAGTAGSLVYLAQPMYFPVNGTITSVTMELDSFNGGASQIRIYTSIGGTLLFQSGNYVNNLGPLTVSCSVAVSAGQTVWVVGQENRNFGGTSSPTWFGMTHFQFGINLTVCEVGTSSFTSGFSNAPGGILSFSSCACTFAQTPVPSSGSWTSPVYDSSSISNIAGNFIESGSYPSGTSATVTVYSSATSNMATPNTQVIANPNGTTALTLTGLEFYQIIVQVASNDNRVTPTLQAPLSNFNTQGIWVSQPIDATTDNTGWQTLTVSDILPTGTSVVLSIATSTDNITYTSFGPIGSAATTQYAKVQAVLNTDTNDTVTPAISQIVLTWALTSQIESSAIDTGATPSGYGIFTYQYPNLGVGTVQFYIRTATTALLLASASYVAVNNGDFPAVNAYEFAQWKAVLTSTADNIPEIDSITVNWFVTSSSGSNIRMASLFYNKNMYWAAATVGSNQNDTLIQLDQFGNWRIMKDISVGTMFLYFNQLFFTDGLVGNVYNGFNSVTDNGSPIVMDIRTKCFNYGSDLVLKQPRAFKVTGINTGTTIHTYYSIDRGATWLELLNEQGVTGYQTAADKSEFTVYFVPDFSNDTSQMKGRNIIYRITSADIYPCSIINFGTEAWISKAKYLSNGG